MQIEYSHLIPTDFNENSRVWIYQSSRVFGIGEALQIEEILNDFIANWKSHGAAVKGFATLLLGRFVVIMADETITSVGGCSTDSSVSVVKQIEETFKVNMFDRQTLCFVVKDKIEMLPLTQLNYAVENGFIKGDTMYFNNLVNTKAALLTNWIIPAKESWLATKMKLTSSAIQ